MPPEGVIVLNHHLRDISSNLVSAFSSEQRPVIVEHSGRECLVPTKHVQPITLILCEILTNALKYSHPSGVPVRISLLCEASSNGALQVTVSDDGIGLPEGFDTTKDGGLGFQIIRMLTTELGGTLDVFSDNLGSTFRLTVPQALVANAQTA
jgi:two-component sensor histidine kinase